MDNLYSSFYLYRKYEIIGDELIDLGITSIDADGTQEPVMKEECDPACGCPIEPIYRWVQTEDTVCVGEEPAVQYRWTSSGWTCVGYDKYQNNIKEQSRDGGETWTVVIPEEYSASTLIESQSTDCGYVPPTPSLKYKLTLSDSSTVSAECDSTSAITESEVSIPYKNTLVSAEIGNCVTSIGAWAFDSCTGLTSVTIPNTVTSIGGSAFISCSGLTSITIPDSVTSIVWGVFSGCISLTSITVNATTPPTLGTYVFEGSSCPIYVPCASVETYKAATNWSTYASRIEGIPPCGQPTPTIEYRWTQSGTTCIGYDKYQNNIKEQSTDGGTTWTVVTPVEYSASTLIEADSPDCGYVPPTPTTDGKFTLTLSDSSTVSAECDSTSAVTSGEVSSQYSGSVVSAVIGDCVTSIGNSAFTRCTSLTSVYLPDSMTSIGRYAFLFCSGLTTVYIPDSVTSIGGGAFQYCRSLTSCTIGSGVTYIDMSAFEGCRSLTSIVIPDSVTIIDVGAFSYCTSLTSCTIGSGVRYIDNNTFMYCINLTSIDIPDSVTYIDVAAFQYCSGLTNCTIGSGVTSIGGNAFRNCSSLTSITVNATTPPTLGSSAFEGSSCPIYVLSASVEAYKADSGWSTYADRIQPIP